MNNNMKKILFAICIVVISIGASATTVWTLNNGVNDNVITPSSVFKNNNPTNGIENSEATSSQNYGNIGSAPNLTPAAESSVKAVVHIKNEQTVSRNRGAIDPFEFFFGPGFSQGEPQPVVGYGSGVIISTDGYIMTNNHVIDNSNKLTVTLNDNRTFEAKVIGSDPVTDIALIKIEAKDLPTIPFGNSDDIRLGEWVLAVGNPFNLTATVTAGIISAKSRTTPKNVNGNLSVESFIQTDAAVNPGSSGGALVNAQGKLIGINTMIYSQTGNYAGCSFAVPINLASKIVTDIKQFGSVQKGVLGVIGGDVTSDLVEKEKLKVSNGVYVADFSEISAAFAAGLEKGDVIIAVNDNPIKDFGQLTDQLGQYRPSDKVKITVDRKGTKKDFTVTLKNSEGGNGLIKGSKDKSSTLLGATLKPIDTKKMRGYGISFGVEVTDIKSGILKNAGVKEGFIIIWAAQKPIKTPKDLNDLISSASKRGQNIVYIRGVYPSTGDVADYALTIPSK